MKLMNQLRVMFLAVNKLRASVYQPSKRLFSYRDYIKALTKYALNSQKQWKISLAYIIH